MFRLFFTYRKFVACYRKVLPFATKGDMSFSRSAGECPTNFSLSLPWAKESLISRFPSLWQGLGEGAATGDSKKEKSARAESPRGGFFFSLLPSYAPPQPLPKGGE
jgi:hypothetical protein